MTLFELFASYDDTFRKYVYVLPPKLTSLIYSNGRKFFLNRFVNRKIDPIKLPNELKIKVWDIEFNCGLFNAAGMFKDGRGYEVCYNMGAGAFLAGTTTYNPREGNKKDSIKHPFMPYYHSKMASNWMGLPNPGYEKVANVLSKIEKKKGCPIGVSTAFSDDEHALYEMYECLKCYDEANVDFIELNVSCPNVPHSSSKEKIGLLPKDLVDKLEFVSQYFIKKCNRYLPIIVKLSNDTSSKVIPALLDVLIDLKFSGINLGNTSTDYKFLRKYIKQKDRKQFDYFTKTFGGGVSGEALKNNSLRLCKEVVEYLKDKRLREEFHCIRTGGINCAGDIIESKNNGIILNEWYTGFFENFTKYGFNTYEKLFK